MVRGKSNKDAASSTPISSGAEEMPAAGYDRTPAGTLPHDSPAQVASADCRTLLHRFNQPLTAISNYAQAGIHLIDAGGGDSMQLRELFEKIVVQSGRTVEISQALGAAFTGEGRA